MSKSVFSGIFFYYPILYSDAVQRYFESQKRKWRESSSISQQARILVQAKKRKVRARKVRVSSCCCFLSFIIPINVISLIHICIFYTAV